ncbi:MAG TPA: transposase family protein [Pseudobacteroides sp.]|nr:transposase family protein [Pseudobacteroides sp.]
MNGIYIEVYVSFFNVKENGWKYTPEEKVIKVPRDEARVLRRGTAKYIIHHKLKQNSKLYTFLNEDSAWCADFAEFYIDGEKHYLFKIIDDFSSFDIATAILKRATTANALEVINDAFERWGKKPLCFKSDRGPQFKI